MKKKLVVISLVVVVVAFLSICLVEMNYRKQSLTTYTMIKFGMSITKDNIEYSWSSIPDTKLIGRKIGQGEFGGVGFSIYKKKGEDIHKFIIVDSDNHGKYTEYKAVKK